MKILGLTIIIVGFILLYVGITGNQHNLMAVITGKTAVQSGQQLNPSGNDQTNPPNQTQTTSNPPSGTMAV